MASMPSRPSSPRSLLNVGARLSSRSPLIPPPRHALCDHAQAGFRGGEVRKAGLAAQAGGGAGEDDRAAAERSQSPRRLAADQKPAKAADPPELLELLRAQLSEIDAPVVAGIEDDNVGRRAAIAGRHRPIKQTNDIVLACRVGRDGFGAAARFANRFGHLRNLLGRSASDEHMIALGGEAPAERGAKPALGAYTCDHGSTTGSDGAHAPLLVPPPGSPASNLTRTCVRTYYRWRQTDAQ